MNSYFNNAPQSTCSQRVRFVLNAKGLAFEEHKLDLFAGDQLKPDYLRIKPNGVDAPMSRNTCLGTQICNDKWIKLSDDITLQTSTNFFVGHTIS